MKYNGKWRIIIVVMGLLISVILVKCCTMVIKSLSSSDTVSGVKDVYARQNEAGKEVDVSNVGPEDLPNPVNTDGQAVTIMLDAGHGGNDPGTHEGNLVEKDITLDYVNEIKTLLEAYGFDVVLSREDDTYIAPKKRAHVANKKKVDLFVSIHCNYYEWDSNISGLECYYAGGSSEGELFADTISNTLDSHGDVTNRGSKSNNYRVLVNTKMPAILIELGYLSNYEDCRLMVDNTYRKRLAEELAEGIYNYSMYTSG